MTTSPEPAQPSPPKPGPPPKGPRNWVAVARLDKTVFIRVVGVGNLTTAPAVAEFADHERIEGYREFVFDLAECRGMDSTFMGTMVGIAAALNPDFRSQSPFPGALRSLNLPGSEAPKAAPAAPEAPSGGSTGATAAAAGEAGEAPKEPEGFVAVVNVSPECLEMLKILGVDRFVRVGGTVDLSKLELERLPDRILPKEERSQLVLKAHENLVEIDRRNEAKFGAFLRQLASELGKR